MRNISLQTRTESTHGVRIRAFQLFFQNAWVFRLSSRAFSAQFQNAAWMVGVRMPCQWLPEVCQPLLCVPELVFSGRAAGCSPSAGLPMTKSISCSMISSLKITLMAVSTTNRSSGSLRMAFQVAVRLAVAFGVCRTCSNSSVFPMLAGARFRRPSGCRTCHRTAWSISR